jgi:hypothetical protein
VSDSMREPEDEQPERPTGRSASPPHAEDDTPPVSRQARRLHALGLLATVRADSGGLLGRREAEQLAAQSGAVIAELVVAGLWKEYGPSYGIRDGARDDGTQDVAEAEAIDPGSTAP